MWIYIALTFALATSSLTWAQCVPGDNCKLPDCRCWDDPNAPGGLTRDEIPQVVLVSFQYAVNSANVGLYRDLFEGITNPNKCPLKATYFVQKVNTDFAVVKELHDDKNEIGMTSLDGLTPKSSKEWKDNFVEMKANLIGAGIPEKSVQGSRAPELFAGGNDHFEAIEEAGLTYDSTCSSRQYSQQDSLLWPFTYDFPDGTPTCVSGQTPTGKFAGKWQFLVADLEFDGNMCASPSSCSPYIKDAQDAFDLLYDAFARHYEGGRTPFVLYIDPLWLTMPYQLQGTRQFLQFVRAAFDDTWILTTQQSLAWIQDPVPSANASTFAPWQC